MAAPRLALRVCLVLALCCLVSRAAAAGCELPPVIDLGSLDGSDGFALRGIDPDDATGLSVAGGFDLDGDGRADLAIGAPDASPAGRAQAGRTFVVFGRPGGFPADVDLSDLGGADGVVIEGAADDHSGWSVAGAGDVNDDGIDDLVVGAPGTTATTGKAYVVFGRSVDFPPSIDLSTLDGTEGFALVGALAGGGTGRSVAGGDVNGDGIDDVVLGSPDGASGATGQVHVLFGSSSSFPAQIDVSDLDGSNGFTMTGESDGDRAGASVATVDVDDDDLADVLIGAPDADPSGRTSAGRAYVVFARTSSFPATIDLGGMSGSTGFSMSGVAAGDGAGVGVSGAGDVNDDGVQDLAIGAAAADGGSGAGYVVFGDAGGFPSAIQLSALDGGDGFRIEGIDPDDGAGGDVGAAGDVNGDGADDLILGARSADPGGRAGAGQCYVVYGHAGAFPASMQLASLDGRRGFSIDGADAAGGAGVSVSGAGDLDGDGIADVVVGADAAGGTGEAYVVLGAVGGGAADHAVGEGLGPTNGNRVRIYDADGAPTTVDFLAYASGGFGSNVARADIGGSCGIDIITGPGPSGALAPWVRSFDESGAVLSKASFYAFGTMRFGVNVGAADLDGDGLGELLAGAGPGAVFGPHVRGWNYDGGTLGPIPGVSFFAYGVVGYGVNVAGANGDADARAELVTGSGPGPTFDAQVRGFDYTAGEVVGIAKASFNAFPWDFGVVVAAGDVDGDGIAEIAAAPGPGDTNAARYRGFSFGASALPGFDTTLPSGTRYGGRLALGDVTGDGAADLLTGLGRDPAALSTVRTFAYDGDLQPVTTFNPFPADRYGVNVAAW